MFLQLCMFMTKSVKNNKLKVSDRYLKLRNIRRADFSEASKTEVNGNFVPSSTSVPFR